MGFAAVFHIYIYWKLRAAFGAWRWRWLILFFGELALFEIFPLGRYFDLFGEGRLSEILFALTITDYIIAGMLTVVLVLTDVLKLVLCLLDKALRTRTERFITPRAAAVFSLAFVLCSVLYGYCEAWHVREVRLVIPSAKLPEGCERVRIVQVSDVHIGGVYPARHLERVMAMVRAAEPDIFVVTGDLVDGDMAHRSREAELVAANGAKHGAFAITGNHEYNYNLSQALDFIGRCSLTLLSDQMTEAAGITIAGLDDFTLVWPPDLRTPQDRFVLLLRHRPHVLKTSRDKFDLQLSGHTHGGQLWPLGPLRQKLQGFVQGLSKDGKSFVYVCNGTGYWAAPLRLLTPPDVTVIDLVRDGSAPHEIADARKP